MALMADQHDVIAELGVAPALVVDLADQRTGGIDDVEPARGGRGLDAAGDAMGGEDRGGAARDLVDFADEDRALGAQALDDMGVVDDFVADIDRRAMLRDGALDDLDGADDAGTEAARLRQQHGQRAQGSPAHRAGS